MNDLNKAYKIIDSIPLDADRDLAFKMAKEAFEESMLCVEAAIIMSHCFDNLEDKEKVLLQSTSSLFDAIYNQKVNDETLINNLDKANYELGSIYYEYGMYRKALEIFETIKDNNELLRYKLMNIYALLEDERIKQYYDSLVNDLDEIEFIRLSFPYMIYLYKKNELDNSRKLFKEINKINPDIKKALNGEEVINEEAYKVLKNNSLLINSCPYIIKDLVI